MCTPTQGAMLPYGLKLPSTYFPFGPSSGLTQAHLSAFDFQRSQINDYNIRVQLGLRNYQNSLGISPFHAYINDPYAQAYFYKHDPRARFVQEEPKPSHSYIGLIGMAILNSKEKKLVLSDIYQWILDNYPYFRTRGPGWRNSIRHNLSLNDCFIKSGRSANGKGHYWAVHPANVEDFERGDFRRRRAQRKVRRHMGLSVPDDDDSPTPSPSQPWTQHDTGPDSDRTHAEPPLPPGAHGMRLGVPGKEGEHLLLPHAGPMYAPPPTHARKPSRKRLFDMASLLAPDDDDDVPESGSRLVKSETESSNIHPAFIFQPIPEIKVDHNISKEQRSLSDSMTSEGNESCTSQKAPSRNSNRCFDFPQKETYDDSDNDNRDVNEDDDNEEIQVTSDEDESPFTPKADPCTEERKFLPHEGDRKSHLLDRQNGDLMVSTSHSSIDLDKRLMESQKGLAADNAMDLSSGSTSSLSPSSSSPAGVDTGIDQSRSRIKREDERPCSQVFANGEHGSHSAGSSADPYMAKETHFGQGHRSGGRSQTEQSDTYTKMDSESGAVDEMSERSYDSDPRSPRRTPRDGSFLPEGSESTTPRGTDHGVTPSSSHSIRHDHLSQMHLLRNTDMALSSYDRVRHGELGSEHYNSETTPHRSSAGDDSSKIPNLGLVRGMGPMSEALRRSSEAVVTWSNVSKTVSSRDRLSAFSSLGLRQHSSLYPPQFQHSLARGFPMAPVGQRLLLPVPSQVQARPRVSIPGPPMPQGATTSSFDPLSPPVVKGVEIVSGPKRE